MINLPSFDFEKIVFMFLKVVRTVCSVLNV